MNSGTTSENAYDLLKQQILSSAFRPGQRLKPTDLSQMLEMSITPVRDALHVLAGEGLVEARTSNGFHLPLAAEGFLRDLYAWNAEVLLIAISSWPKRRRGGEARPPFPPLPTNNTDPQELFDRIAMLSGNREHIRMVRSNGERLHAARHAEHAMIIDMQAELKSLEAAANEPDHDKLRLLIKTYHRRRQLLITSIVNHINVK